MGRPILAYRFLRRSACKFRTFSRTPIELY